MATILTKKSDTASSVPLAADLTNAAGGAELAVNTADKRLYSKTSGGTVVELGTNPSALSLPNGTANGIPYLNGSKVLTSGSALTFDGTTLQVGGGIGLFRLNASASDYSLMKLAVAGTNYGSFGVGTGGEVVWNANSLHLWNVNSSEGMRLTSTGLGIGTSSPSQRLAVINNTTYQARAATATGNYTSGGMVFGGFGADASDPNYYGAVGYDHSTGKTYLRNRYFTATGGIAFQISTSSGFSDAALIDSSGNLGLGVTPSAWSGFKAFDIGATGSVACLSTQQQIGMNYYWNGSNYIYKTTNAASYYNQNSGSHAWYTAPSGTAGNAISFTQAMTLDASGNFLVGQTSGTAKISATQSGSNDVIRANIGSGGAAFLAVSSAPTMTAGYWNTSSGYAGSITCSGTTTIYAVTSDHRLKNVIGSVIDAGSRIDALEPIEYEWKTDGKRTRGFLAHKFQEIYPHSVHGEKDAVDPEGNPAYQTMQAGTSEVIADFAAEIQSIRKRLAALESK